MKAIRVEEYGGPEVLLRRDMPTPSPGPEEVLVEVAYAGINFMDVHTRQGKYRRSTTYPVRLPLTLGMEGAGIVHAVGADVGGIAVGDRVAWCISWGSYADFAIVPAFRLAVVPDEIGLDLAAAAIFQGSTAHYLVSDVGRLTSESICLVHAAAGGIGQLVTQLAKRRGARVYATVSSAEKAEVAKAAGADRVLYYDDGRFADAIREDTQGEGVDVVFDAVGRTTLRDSFRATRRRGLVVNFGSVAGSVDDLDPIELGESGSLYLTRPRLADHMTTAEEIRGRARDVFDGLADGSITLPISGRYSFDAVEQAHAALEGRRQIGKAVLDLSL